MSKWKNKEEDDHAWLTGLPALYTLKKKGSPHKIDFIVDKLDDWFIHVVTIRNKTNKIEDISMIIRKDIPGWITYLATMGWVASEPLYKETNLTCI
jgi:hypothetical protein